MEAMGMGTMVVSRKSEAYANYLVDFKAKHPAPGPVYTDDPKVAFPAGVASKVFEYRSKAFGSGRGEASLRSDGKVSEAVITSSGNWTTYAVFESMANRDAFEVPMSFNVYFEHW